jgi:hypothetical protein
MNLLADEGVDKQIVEHEGEMSDAFSVISPGMVRIRSKQK